MLTRLLVAAAVAWPLVAGAALWHRVTHPHDGPGWATVVYLAAAQVCHQRPERSFETDGVAWPVCARCTGLYLAAPFGAFLALGRVGKSRGLEVQAALRGQDGLRGQDDRGLEVQAALRGQDRHFVARPGSQGRGSWMAQPLALVALAAVPTALTLAWEWGGLGTPSNSWRLVTALPLGMAVAFVVIQVTRPNQVH